MPDTAGKDVVFGGFSDVKYARIVDNGMPAFKYRVPVL